MGILSDIFQLERTTKFVETKFFAFVHKESKFSPGIGTQKKKKIFSSVAQF